jgi:hypothetical protein
VFILFGAVPLVIAAGKGYVGVRAAARGMIGAPADQPASGDGLSD